MNIAPLRASHSAGVVARRKPDVSLEQAKAEMDAIGRTLAEQFPNENTGHAPNVVPFRRLLVGDVRDALLVLLRAVGIVLVIACANVATLLLARATSRPREIAIRVAIGAGRRRLVRQLLTESLLLGLAGGAAGVLLADWSVHGLRAVLPKQFSALPGIDHAGVDLRVLAVALAVTVLTSMVFGLIPALATSYQRAGAALNEEGRCSGGSLRGRRARALLVVAEMALSLMLLIGAGLLIVSFKRLANVSPGFQAEHAVAAQLSLPGNRYPDHPRLPRSIRRSSNVFTRCRTWKRSAPGRTCRSPDRMRASGSASRVARRSRAFLYARPRGSSAPSTCRRCGFH